MTLKKGESERESTVNTASTDTIVPSDKEIINNKKNLLVHRNKTLKRTNWNSSGRSNTVEAATKESKKRLTKPITEREGEMPKLGMDWLWDLR